MRKTWKKLMAYGVASALMVSSFSFGGNSIITARAAESSGETGFSVNAKSTSDFDIPENPSPFRDLTAQEIIQEMGVGWNLGNTMDGHNNYAVGETLWQNDVTTKEIIKGVHDLGFNNIRIPVTWGNMINKDYSVDEQWMGRVQEIVDYAASENMYVILNIHHDGASNGEGSPHGWLDIAGTDEEFAAVREKFDGLWKTIAERFKNYDEHLLFASMNEVYDHVTNGGIGWSNDENLVNVELERINLLNQDFVDIVRATGSNNAKRWVIAPTKNTQIKTIIEDRFNYVLPTDEAKRVMVEVHDYDAWSGVSLREDRDGYAKQFKAMKEQYVDNGVPIVIGEFGFGPGSKRQYSFEGVGYLLKKYQMIGCVWDNNSEAKTGDGYKIINRVQGTSYDGSVEALMRGFFYDTDRTDVVDPPESRELTDFTVSKDTVTIKAGETEDITISERQPENSNDVVVWKSDNGEIASVINGKITARAVGTTKVTAVALNGSVAKEIAVTVEPQELETPSTEVKTDYGKYELDLEDEGFLNASVVPAGNGAYVTFKSADDSIVTVSTTGRMLAKKLGETTVTITTSDGVTKDIPVKVVEPAAPAEFKVRLAVHAYYNDKEHTYYGTDLSTDIVTVEEDGVYTLKFDCSTDLSEAAKTAGVTSLNNIGSLYIKDYDVTMGNNRRSPNVSGKIRYNSIKVNGTELLSGGDTQNQNALKSGIFDTGNPFNIWDGSVVSTGITENKTDNCITFDGIDNPTVMEITFTLSGFTGEVTDPVTFTPAPSPDATATVAPAAPTAPVTSGATSAPAITTDGVKKGDVKTISGAKYTVTNVKSKTVEYKAPTKKTLKSATIPNTVKITVNGKKVTYKVTSIAKNAFKNNKKLTKVTIGTNVKKIGANAFSGCSKLKTVTIKSKKLTSIGKNAFKGINKKAVFKVPKAKKKAYKKLLKKNTGFKGKMKVK